MKNILKYAIVLLCVINFYACGDKEGETNAKNKAEIEKQRLENNKELFIKTYDDIAYQSIDLVLDRVYNENPSSKPNIANIPLNEFKNMIKGTSGSDNITKTYIDSLISFKKKYLKKNDLFNDKESFKSIFKDVSEWKLINNKIIYGLSKDGLSEENLNNRKEKGTTLLINIKETINKAISSFKSKEVDTEETAKTNTTGHSTDETGTSGEVVIYEVVPTFLHSVIGLLILSVLMNIFLGWKLSKKKPITETAPVNGTDKRSTYQKNVSDFKEKILKEEEKKSISKIEIQNIVDSEHKKMLNNLSKYSKACLDTVDNLKSTKNDVVEIILKKKLLEIDHVKRTAAANLDVYEKNVDALLKNCNDKNLATQKIEKAIDLAQQGNFGLAKLHLVSKPEKDLKVELRKNNLIGELPLTITTDELTQKIEKLIFTIKGDLSKLIEESLIYYLPFSDANGYFKDSKKAKTKKIDSVIKMHVDPDNPSKATFQFMYEEKNMLKNAILSYDVLLLPICTLKSENFDRQGTVIEQIGPNGTLQLVDDLWQVEEKLNIKII